MALNLLRLLGVAAVLAGPAILHVAAIDEVHAGLPSLPGPHAQVGPEAENVEQPAGPTAPVQTGPHDLTHDHNSLYSVHMWAEYVVLPLSATFIVAIVICNILHTHHISWIPESLVLALLGIGLSIVEGFLMGNGSFSYESVGAQVNEELFGAINSTVLNLVLLPLIIFESGWSLRRMDFASQIAYILLLAIFGTLISVFVVAMVLRHLYGWHLNTVLIYAALISAVDPVATLSTYGALKVEPLLNTLVFGESVINDAVAIALFNALNAAGAANVAHTKNAEKWEERQTMYQMAPAVSLNVLWIMFGSLGIGAALGIMYCLLIRFGRMHHNSILETLFIFVSCFFTYALAHAVNLSGIIAVLFCSIIMNIYAKRSLSAEGAELSGLLLKQMASLADMMVFLFCGAAVVLVHSATQFTIAVMCACLVGRLVAILPLSLLINCLKRATGAARGIDEEDMNLLNYRQMFMMWHAGLRGGIALVLCLELGEWIDELEGPGTRQKLRNGTFVTIFVFLMVFGGSTQFFLKTLGIAMGKDWDTTLLFEKEAPKFLKTVVRRLHSDVLLPVLVGDEEEEDSSSADDATISTRLGALVANHAGGHGRGLKVQSRKQYNDISDSDRSGQSDLEE